MDALLDLGITWVLAVQSLGDWLIAPMEFFSFLGREEFFLLILPALYWSVDARLGFRVGMILLVGNGLNGLLKMAFYGPRPFWYSPEVRALSLESSFGVPSGHAQNAVSVWGMMAAGLRRRWAWWVAGAVMFLIGFSRVYLGVHFAHDVIIGWLIGALVLWVFLKYWDAVAGWLRNRTLGNQVLIAFAVSLVFILLGMLAMSASEGWVMPESWRVNAIAAGVEEDFAPISITGLVTTAGAFFGLAVGAAWLSMRGWFDAGGAFWKRLVRFLAGLVGVLILYIGLGNVFSVLSPDETTLLSILLRYIRYTLIGLWISAGAPLLFVQTRLAGSKSQK